MKTAFVLCSRNDSSRVPGKPFRKINGKPVLTHLIERLQKTNIPVILAVPAAQFGQYEALKLQGLHSIYLGSENDPLDRMYKAAKDCGFDNVIRVTHDKIFVDPDLVLKALSTYHEMNLDYLYSSKFTDGSGFEIISFQSLERAAHIYKNVEYISYAIRSVTDNSHDFDVPPAYRSDTRLLIDYPEDLTLLETVFSALKYDCTLRDVLNLTSENPWIKSINKLPELTVYTCVYNGEKWVERAMGSVAKQKGFRDFQYVIIDDHSTDKTGFIVSKFASLYPNVSWIKNDKNIGLASSSNVALKQAKGNYIMRLDHDDYLTSETACQQLLHAIKERKLDAVYPNNFYGSQGVVQNGKECHHIGGSIFRTRAINHIKFTDGLRNYEGLDFFQRAKTELKIGYLNKPLFVYSQLPNSMSKSNLEERLKTKEKILSSELGQ